MVKVQNTQICLQQQWKNIIEILATPATHCDVPIFQIHRQHKSQMLAMLRVYYRYMTLPVVLKIEIARVIVIRTTAATT